MTPFERVHVDFAGKFLNHYFFILVDAYTKWPEIHIVKNMLAENTVLKCSEIFANFGLPELLVSDNGKTFESQVFEKFLKENGILHKFSAPYYPATNGQAERYVQMIKESLKKMDDPKNIDSDVRKILFQYRNMVHPHTNKTPAELFLGRKLRCRLSLLKPSVEVRRLNSVNDHLVVKRFQVGQKVIARNYNSKRKWVFGVIKAVKGKLHYEIQLENGGVWRRHVNQLRSAKGAKFRVPEDTDGEVDFDLYIPPEEMLILGARTAIVKQAEPVVPSESLNDKIAPDFSEVPGSSTPDDPKGDISFLFERSEEPGNKSKNAHEEIAELPGGAERPKRNVKPPQFFGDPVTDFTGLNLSDIH